jgi:hypothetical protein
MAVVHDYLEFDMLKNLMKRVGIVSLATASVGAFAAPAPVDYTQLTSSVDFSGVITAILAIAVILCAVYVARTGVRFVLNMVKGG